MLNLLARVDSYGVSIKPGLRTKEFEEKPGQAIVQYLETREVVVLELPAGKGKQVIFPVLDKKGKVVGLLINHCAEMKPAQRRLTGGNCRAVVDFLKKSI